MIAGKQLLAALVCWREVVPMVSSLWLLGLTLRLPLAGEGAPVLCLVGGVAFWACSSGPPQSGWGMGALECWDSELAGSLPSLRFA